MKAETVNLASRCLIFTATSLIIGYVLVTNVSAHPAWGIAVDRNNQIYFSDIETIWKIDAQGKLVVFRAGVSGHHMHDLNIDAAGNLYGAENSYEPATERFVGALWKMTPEGDFSYLLAPTDNLPQGISIWRDSEGNMYHVGNYPKSELLILRRTPNGTVSALVGNSDAVHGYRQGSPFSVGGTAFGSDGALYFTAGPNIGKVTMDGRLTMLVQNLALENPAESPMPESRFTRLFGIAVDAQGNAFVADYNNRSVLKITSAGTVSTVARAEQPWSPTGIALKDGDVYILEFRFTLPSTYTPRVRKLSPDGRLMTIATLAENAENDHPSAGGSAAQRNSERSLEPKPGLTYILLGAGGTIVALAIVIYYTRRRISSRRQQQ